jgi:putative heme-binding domain-containing protein
MRAICFCLFLAAGVLPGVSQEQAGDAARGKALFEGKAGCQNCHRIKGEGRRMGPDLSEIGSARRAAQLEQSILEPDAEIAPQNRPFRVVTKAGETVNGKLLNQDTFTVQILDSKEHLRSFSKEDLREYAFVDKSPMPSFRGKLTREEIADLVAYLGSLKAPERAGVSGLPQGRGGAGTPAAAPPAPPANPKP